jgi:AraC-like DNA-binding protein
VAIAMKTEQDFLSAPVRSGFVRGQVAAWCADDELQGYAVWGNFTSEVARQVFATARSLHTALPSTRRRKLVISLDALAAIEWSGVEEVMRARTEVHAERRAAGVALFESVVRPHGVLGAIVAGAYHMFVATKRQRVHADLDAALDWLGRAEEAAAVGAFLREAACRPRIVDELRAHLAAHLDAASLATAARALGIAQRTLQLELAKERASFRAIRDELRLREAKARLEQSNDKIDHLARALGFRSSRHFYKWFRDRTGETPGDWRERGPRPIRAR